VARIEAKHMIILGGYKEGDTRVPTVAYTIILYNDDVIKEQKIPRNIP
jgi:hypothetical protein